MDIEKVKRILKKIKALVENMDEQGSVSSLERDLLKSYLRDVYEAVATKADTNPVTSPIPDTPLIEITPPPPPEVEQTVPAEQEPAVEPGSRQQPDDTPVVPEVEPEPAAAIQEVRAEQPAQPVAVTASNVDAAPEQAHADALLGLFEQRSSAEVADKLQSQPITAIQDEMGINERLLTINELFGGNPKAFEETVQHLNGLSDFSDAREYLLSGPAKEYVWGDENRVNKARSFVQLVRRKYL